MEQQIARIALSGVPYSADKLYSYLVPPELADACRAGVRVSVPFGRGMKNILLSAKLRLFSKMSACLHGYFDYLIDSL